MKRIVLLITFILTIATASYSQSSSSTAFRFRTGATLPTTCRVGDVFYKTAATAGQYNCTATNTWTAAGGGGGGSGTLTATGLSLPVNQILLGNTYPDTKPLGSLGTTTTVLHGNAASAPSFGAVVEADITLAANTTNNVSTTKHGFAPVLPNDATKYLDGTGTYSVPAGGVIGGGTTGTLPIWTSGTGLGDSAASQSGADFIVQSIGNVILGDPGVVGNGTKFTIDDVHQEYVFNKLTTGFVLSTSGTLSSVGSTGTGNVARAASPTFTGTVGAAAITLTGVLTAGSGPTTLTDSAGKILSAALNTVGVAQGGTGLTALGTALQQLRVNAGATALEYFTPAASGLTIGTTAITSGTTTQMLYDNAGVVGESAGVTTDGTNLSLTGGSLTFTGNISASGLFGTSGIRHKGVAATFNDTTSSGTVATAYTNVFGGNTLTATSATTITNYFTAYFMEPTASTNVTLTNKWAIGGDSLKIGTSNPLTVSNAGVLAATAPVFTTNITTPAIITASGALTITPASNSNVTLSTTGRLQMGGTTASFGALQTDAGSHGQVWVLDATGGLASGGGLKTYALWIQSGSFSSNTAAQFRAANNAFDFASNSFVAWTNTADDATATRTASLSQISSGLLGVGTGSQGSFAGSLALTNAKLGATTSRGTTEGTNTLTLFNGTAPVGTLANGGSIYSSGGELFVIDAGGTATQISPHDDEGNWVFNSKDTKTGKRLKIDVEKLLRFLNDKFGTDFIHEYVK